MDPLVVLFLDFTFPFRCSRFESLRLCETFSNPDAYHIWQFGVSVFETRCFSASTQPPSSQVRNDRILLPALCPLTNLFVSLQKYFVFLAKFFFFPDASFLLSRVLDHPLKISSPLREIFFASLHTFSSFASLPINVDVFHRAY